MRKLLVALMAASMFLALPGTAEATTKRFVVTIKATPPSLVIETCEGEPTGASLKLTGTVSPIRAGKSVRIYKRIAGKDWVIEGYAKIRSSGRYTFYDKPTTKTTREYKARMPTVGSYSFAYSPTISVWVGKDSCPD